MSCWHFINLPYSGALSFGSVNMYILSFNGTENPFCSVYNLYGNGNWFCNSNRNPPSQVVHYHRYYFRLNVSLLVSPTWALLMKIVTIQIFLKDLSSCSRKIIDQAYLFTKRSLILKVYFFHKIKSGDRAFPNGAKCAKRHNLQIACELSDTTQMKMIHYAYTINQVLPYFVIWFNWRYLSTCYSRCLTKDYQGQSRTVQ